MKNRKLIIMIIIYAIVLILIGVYQPREINWRPTFAAADKIPFGAYILKERLSDLFPGSNIETTTESVYMTLHKKHFTNTNYILIENQWNASNTDIKELLNFVSEGNNVFIAAQRFPSWLNDTLGVYMRYAPPQLLKTITKTDTTKSLAIHITNPAFGKDTLYQFETNNIPEHFSSKAGFSSEFTPPIPSETTGSSNSDKVPLAEKVTVLSTISQNWQRSPIYVQVTVGKGNIYLHSYPFAFSNYYLIKDSTRGYAEQCLSYLPNGKIIWDEHYKMEQVQKHVSTLSFILTNSSLRWAYYTGVIFVLVFVLFSIKRRQRIIPVVAPFRNTTLEFTETVGRLYFNRADHKNLAEKKIRYFMEYVRSQYYLDTQDLNADFINKLANKSGLELDRVQYMVEVVKSMIKKQSISDSELIQLNELIEYFKTHSN